MRLLHLKTSAVKFGIESATGKNKLNQLVTVGHIGIILAFTIAQTLSQFAINKKVALERILDVWIIFGGTADLFLSVMLWFILGEINTPAVQLDGDRTYAVLDVARIRQSGLNPERDDQDEEEIHKPSVSSSNHSRNFSVAERMIAQFFLEEEGPHRDWQKDYRSFNEDRMELILFD